MGLRAITGRLLPRRARGPSPAGAPARPEEAGDGEGQRVIKRLAHYGKTGSGSGRELPPNPGERQRKLELA